MVNLFYLQLGAYFDVKYVIYFLRYTIFKDNVTLADCEFSFFNVLDLCLTNALLLQMKFMMA